MEHHGTQGGGGWWQREVRHWGHRRPGEHVTPWDLVGAPISVLAIIGVQVCFHLSQSKTGRGLCTMSGATGLR